MVRTSARECIAGGVGEAPLLRELEQDKGSFHQTEKVKSVPRNLACLTPPCERAAHWRRVGGQSEGAEVEVASTARTVGMGTAASQQLAA